MKERATTIESFEKGLEGAQFFGNVACFLAALVAFVSTLLAISITLFIFDIWPEALIGVSGARALDALEVAHTLTLLVSFYFVGGWIYQAHSNFYLIDGPAKQFTPNWAVGWFFVPIANLIVPFRAMRELWQGSHRVRINSDASAPNLLWVWWISWIAALFSILGETHSIIDIVGYGAISLSAVALILIIRAINRAQPDMAHSSNRD